MMIGAQLQAAIFAALTGAGICDGRVYDGVPENALFPYVTIGDSQVIDDGGSEAVCTGGWEVFEDIHIWSRPPARSKRELKAIAAQVIAALSGFAGVEGYAVVVRHLQTFRAFRDPDGLTEHGVLTVRFVLDPLA
ncbi:MAG: DUF3168 domain-containing protein [Hyphomicrobiaceae bacterium]